MKQKIIISILLGLTWSACKKNTNPYDASGTFEATEIIVSAEATGDILQLNLEEGEILKAGRYVGCIDSVQLYLKRKQLLSQIKTTLSQKPNISKQLAALNVQLQAAEREQKRIGALLKADAATPKQMDDINAQINVIQKQIEAQQSTLGIASEGISEQAIPLMVQIEQINDQLRKCKIINPVEGTVMTKYAQANEMTNAGKAIYKIANMSHLILRIYITGDQFSSIKINQKVKVMIDQMEGQSKSYEGVVEWISDKAEFTPKTIQTKDERANLVYAVKIRVNNDGFLKLGMYADVKF